MVSERQYRGLHAGKHKLDEQKMHPRRAKDACFYLNPMNLYIVTTRNDGRKRRSWYESDI